MQNRHGVFIVLEGSDGSGKGTQFRLLTERLKAVGHEVAVFDFPRYEEPSSYFVKRYLNGEYGPANGVSPYTASIFYALDRYEASPHIMKDIDKGKVVLANRYVGSNMAHQGVKFNSLAEQRGFFMWADSLEYQLLGIPRPNINLVLKVPPDISFDLIAKKADRNYTDKKRDEHEADRQHIKKAAANYDLLCKLFPKDFKEVDCSRDGQILTIVEINDMIWESLKPLLPDPKREGRDVVVSLDQSEWVQDSKNNKNGSRPQFKYAHNYKSNFDEIIKLKNQMLDKSGLVKGVNKQQLKTAINLLTPLEYRISEIKVLLKEDEPKKALVDDEPVAVNEIIGRLSQSIPSATSSEKIKLMTADPRNEFQLLGEAKSNNLNYQQKEHALTSRLEKAASSARYRCEATSNYATLLGFKNEVDVKWIRISPAVPRLDYDVPEIIEIAGLDDPFNKAFEVSSQLYNQMSLSRAKDAFDVLLLGHNVHWQFEVDAAALARVLKTSKNKELINFLDLLSDKIAEYHPHVARIITEDKLTTAQIDHKKRR